jgi:hypothetical protein
MISPSTTRSPIEPASQHHGPWNRDLLDDPGDAIPSQELHPGLLTWRRDVGLRVDNDGRCRRDRADHPSSDRSPSTRTRHWFHWICRLFRWGHRPADPPGWCRWTGYVHRCSRSRPGSGSSSSGTTRDVAGRVPRSWPGQAHTKAQEEARIHARRELVAV